MGDAPAYQVPQKPDKLERNPTELNPNDCLEWLNVPRKGSANHLVENHNNNNELHVKSEFSKSILTSMMQWDNGKKY